MPPKGMSQWAICILTGLKLTETKTLLVANNTITTVAVV